MTHSQTNSERTTGEWDEQTARDNRSGYNDPPRPTSELEQAVEGSQEGGGPSYDQASTPTLQGTAEMIDSIESCRDCGVVQPCVWTAPDELWEVVMQRTDGGGVVCPSCFEKRAEAVGVGLLRWVPEPIDAWRTKRTELEAAEQRGRLQGRLQMAQQVAVERGYADWTYTLVRKATAEWNTYAEPKGSA